MMHLSDPARDSDREGGFSSLLLIISVLGIALVGMQLVRSRFQREMQALAHENLVVEKQKVKAALTSNLDCAAINLAASCSPGSKLALLDKAGAVVAEGDGSTKIGSWNVQAECQNTTSPEFFIMLAKLNGPTGFQKDPLTNQEMRWTRFLPLKSVCGGADPDRVLLKGLPCYGGVEGQGALPSNVQPLCMNCDFKDHYCKDDQRPFPLCPQGYAVLLPYIDRYGWGGVDFTKYTLCKKL